jgi:membrane protease YdiL (CAAX protease family)
MIGGVTPSELRLVGLRLSSAPFDRAGPGDARVIVWTAIVAVVLVCAFWYVFLPLHAAVTLTYGLCSIAVLIALWRRFGLTLGAVGLIRSQLPAALVAAAFVWGMEQVVLLAAAPGPLAVHPIWQRPLAAIAGLAAQLLGNAPSEEAAFHGLIMVQLVCLLDRRGWRWAPGVGFVASQLFFGVTHLPVRLHDGAGLDLALARDLFLTTPLLGAVFAFIYLRTGNLWVAIGVHALHNAPLPLFVAALDGGQLVNELGLALALVWPFFGRRPGDLL